MTTRALQLALAGKNIGRVFVDGARWKLDLQRDYVDSTPRPVLGQAFEDLDLRVARDFREAIPFFVNMLPENGSLLSRWLSHHHQLGEADFFGRLAFVGLDLPGALTITSVDHEGALADGRPVAPRGAPIASGPLDIRMSLAGMQPKLSVDLSADHKVVVPASGLNGRWILKLASNRYPDLPRVEHAMMSLARSVGFEVPETRLATREALSAIPGSMFEGMQSEVYLCRRFDREDEARIHQEDLAQALSVMPLNKYTEGQKHDLVYVAKKLKAILGPEKVVTFFERLIFDVAIGNADAHLKNWSLLYRVPHQPELAPCYDLVPTILWLPQQVPALDWPGKPVTARIDFAALEKVLQQCKLARPDVIARLRELAVRIDAAWGATGRSLGLSTAMHATIDAHLRGVPLMKQLLNG